MGANMVVANTLTVGSLASFCLYAQVSGSVGEGKKTMSAHPLKLRPVPRIPFHVVSSLNSKASIRVYERIHRCCGWHYQSTR